MEGPVPSPITSVRHTGSVLRAVCLLVLLLTACDTLEAQSILRGTVVEDGTGTPLGVVDLRLLDAENEALAAGLSDEEGRFQIEVPVAGTYSLSVRRIGYAPVVASEVQVGDEEEVELRITLAPAAVLLEAVRVVSARPLIPSRIRDFRERAELNQRIGRGRVYTREALDRYGPMSARNLLDVVGYIPNCRPVVLLDGLPIDGPLVGLSAEDLEGVETYRGVTQIPPEYYRYGMCGLTMLWTRADAPGARPFTWRRAIAAGVIVTIMGLLAR